jgi:hypothetical protein
MVEDELSPIPVALVNLIIVEVKRQLFMPCLSTRLPPGLTPAGSFLEPIVQGCAEVEIGAVAANRLRF